MHHKTGFFVKLLLRYNIVMHSVENMTLVRVLIIQISCYHVLWLLLWKVLWRKYSSTKRKIELHFNHSITYLIYVCIYIYFLSYWTFDRYISSNTGISFNFKINLLNTVSIFLKPWMDWQLTKHFSIAKQLNLQTVRWSCLCHK